MRKLILLICFVGVSCSGSKSIQLKKRDCDNRIIGKWRVINFYSTLNQVNQSKNKDIEEIFYLFNQTKLSINGKIFNYWFSDNCERIAFGENDYGTYRNFSFQNDSILRLTKRILPHEQNVLTLQRMSNKNE